MKLFKCKFCSRVERFRSDLFVHITTSHIDNISEVLFIEELSDNMNCTTGEK